MNSFVWIVFLVVLVISLFGTQFYKNRILNKLLKSMKEQDFDTYFKTLDTLLCKYLFPPFNREYMRLNAFFMLGDMTKIKDQFDLIFRMRINKKQEADVAMKAFYFYVDENEKRKAKEMMGRIEKCSGKEVADQCAITYDIFLDRKADYIDQMEAEVLRSEAGPERGIFHFMLALQYSYLNNSAKEKEHLLIAKEDMKETPYEQKIDEMLKKK